MGRHVLQLQDTKVREEAAPCLGAEKLCRVYPGAPLQTFCTTGKLIKLVPATQTP